MDKGTSTRIYIIAGIIFMMAFGIMYKLADIQWVHGKYYKKLAKERTIRNFIIPANKGNIYSADGSLLATSIPSYNIRFDALAPDKKYNADDKETHDFESNVVQLAAKLSHLLHKDKNLIEKQLRNARENKDRYFLIAKGLNFSEYIKIKQFPLFNLGANKGGIIVEQETVREHPMGNIAGRTIGYERLNAQGELVRVGIEGAFGKFLNGKDGKILKQKIAKGQWKPIRDENEIEPQDGYDVISTIDVYIQDIAHHALLKSLQEKNADHGCVVVMETKTGHIKAISNLGRDTIGGGYYETINYAVAECNEPGSTYKLADMMALLEDKKIDTSAVFKTYGGLMLYSGEEVRDSHHETKGEVSLAHGFEQSLNTVMVQAVVNNYKYNPSQFINHLKNWGLGSKLGLPFQGEGKPYIPEPKSKRWSPITLPWMAFGYGVSITPLQTLTYYNAVANNGVMVKPQFVSEIKEWDKTIKKYEPEVINPQICSMETIAKLKTMMQNVVKRGTAKDLYSPNFSMAGKTGTAQADYSKNSGKKMFHISSFVGYFPADIPKYSCIVVVNNPEETDGKYFGSDVAGPVFKRIAQKIFTDSPTTNRIKDLDKKITKQENNYERYYTKAQENRKTIPNLVGMSGMDAVALLGNLGIKVKIIGLGKVKQQSITAGTPIGRGMTMVLEQAP
jgi:cell division protein FtsI (penicillin-binding protein 3)